MRQSAVSKAIEQLRVECARKHGEQVPQLLVAGVDVQADRLEVLIGQCSLTPPIGSFGEVRREGNSTPDSSLVAGVLDCLTLDGKREGSSAWWLATVVEPIYRQWLPVALASMERSA
jgi:hypothetical protein